QQMKAEAIYRELGSVAGVTDDIEAAQQAEYVPAPAPPAAVLQDFEPGREMVVPQPVFAAEPITAVIHQASIVSPGQGEVSIDPGNTYIAGRQGACDFPVSDANVSRQHAEFYWNGQAWAVRDLGSTNGTLVNGQAIGDVLLRDGDHITLGMTTLVFHEANR
ncbi:MAG: FHA domain-containing protein, partial [Coriobacteriia bacterium]|nr:FHA domain-containing protein [Coriobacteriia bacterium]